MMHKPQILVLEDDPAVTSLISTALELQGYRHKTAATGASGLMEALSCRPDVLLLDLGLPDMDGVEVIGKIRAWSQMPILVVSARNEDRDKIRALDAGADDYLTKPFSVDELLARLRAAIRRSALTAAPPPAEELVFCNGGLRLDYGAGSAYLEGAELHLTPIEYKLLCLLSRNAGKVLTYNYILKEVWGGALEDEIPSLRVFMVMLRKKLEKDPSKPQYLQTRVGIGYIMPRL